MGDCRFNKVYVRNNRNEGQFEGYTRKKLRNIRSSERRIFYSGSPEANARRVLRERTGYMDFEAGMTFGLGE